MGGILTMNNSGLTLGLVFGLTVLVLALLSMFLGVGAPVIALLASLYHGYAATFPGAIIGFAWAFVHGYITGLVMAKISAYISSH